MKEKEQKLIFLNSYSPRTGHNFVSEVLKIFTNHKVLIHNRSETRLSSILSKYYSVYDKRIPHKTDKDFMDHLFIDSLRDRIIEKCDTEYSVIKDTSFTGVEILLNMFPNDIHIILLRDPNAVFNSLIKGIRFKNTSVKNIIKKMGIKLGLYPYYYAKKVSKRINELAPDLNKFIIIKYEDLVLKDEKTLTFLKELFQCDKPLNKIIKEIDLIKVINTSFYKEINAKNIWDSKSKTSNFDPIKRKGNSYLIRVGIKYGSKQLRKKLNYI